MPPVSRRAFLLTSGMTVGLITACTDEPLPVPVDPDRVALLAALEREEALLAQSLSWDGESVPSTEVQRVLQTHVERLASTIGMFVTPTSTAFPTPTSSPEPATLSTIELAREADRAADAHTRSTAAAGTEAAQLLASLAASDAAVAAYLRSTRTGPRRAE